MNDDRKNDYPLPNTKWYHHIILISTIIIIVGGTVLLTNLLIKSKENKIKPIEIKSFFKDDFSLDIINNNFRGNNKKTFNNYNYFNGNKLKQRLNYHDIDETKINIFLNTKLPNCKIKNSFATKMKYIISILQNKKEPNNNNINIVVDSKLYNSNIKLFKEKNDKYKLSIFETIKNKHKSHYIKNIYHNFECILDEDNLYIKKLLNLYIK